MLDNAKTLRSNQTEAEQRLWVHLRAHRFMGLKFKRQKPMGHYIVDFVCLERRLIIEIDGGQHAEQVAYDQHRDAWLRSQGYTVLRFWNNDVMQQLEGVLEQIRATLSPDPSPTRGRGGGEAPPAPAKHSPLPRAGEGPGERAKDFSWRQAMSAVINEPQPIRFYRPDYHVKTPQMRSPEYVQMSTAAAITLGLIPGRMHRTSCTHCLNLLVTYPEGCRANCAYCGLARHREEARDYADRNFIRVDWPTARYDEVIERVKQGEDRGRFQRMCISMITHQHSDADAFVLLEKWRREVPGVPVSILSNPTTMERDDLVRMKEMGADIFTVALDAVTPEIFDRTRGKSVDSPHKFETYWRAIGWAAEIFGPDKFGAHLICGMGETEREILEVAQRIKDLGGHNHMFAFFPERGSLMEDWPACDHGQWRRVQLARFILDYAGGCVRDMRFDEEGRVIDFGLPQDALAKIIESGKPFRTSGCPGKDDEEVSACNRPYGDSSPSDIKSFPFALQRRDVALVRRQMQMK